MNIRDAGQEAKNIENCSAALARHQYKTSSVCASHEESNHNGRLFEKATRCSSCQSLSLNASGDAEIPQRSTRAKLVLLSKSSTSLDLLNLMTAFLHIRLENGLQVDVLRVDVNKQQKQPVSPNSTKRESVDRLQISAC